MKDQTSSKLLVTVGKLFLFREAIFYVGFYILGVNINWPSSLSLPTLEILPLIYQKSNAVFIGYYVYLISQIFFIPIAIALKEAFKNNDLITNLYLKIGVGLTTVAVCFKVLGIFRWLFVMPSLAFLLHTNTSFETTELINMHYMLIDAYAGKIGEHLGVQLFGVLSWGAFSLALYRIKTIPRLWIYWLMLSALLFIPFADIFHFDSGIYLTINGIVYSLWAISFGLYLVNKYSFHLKGRKAF